jgi:hypothetical protein
MSSKRWTSGSGGTLRHMVFGSTYDGAIVLYRKYLEYATEVE